MQKTVLFSKKSSLMHLNLIQYEQCQHDHCKKLVNHVKFISNLLSQKILKEERESLRSKTWKGIQSQKIIKDQVQTTLQQQIQNIKKNYLKIKKQLGQLQIENDELFDENQKFRKKIQQLQESLNHQEQFELSNHQKDNSDLTSTKCNQISGICWKNSFYLANKENELIQNRNYQDTTVQTDFKFEQTFNQNSLRNKNKNNTQMKMKYSELIHDYQILELQTITKYKQLQKQIDLLKSQNQQLKRIIKIRNTIQTTRHSLINNLNNILDDFEM